MSQANEITIRVSSPLLFIDDDASSPEPTTRESFQSLTVVKSRSPRSSSDSSPSKPKAENDRKSRLELTIRGENTVINIQTVKPAKQIKHDTDVQDIYELINQSVQQIFQSPGKEEIEKALESAGFKEKKFTKKGVWKMLSAKASSSPEYLEEERYPSIVLLQDPEPELIVEKPKFEFRSRSMMSLRDTSFTPRSLETERSNLEKEKKCLQAEREGLEHGKTKLEQDKRSLERSKSFFIQDQNILKEKRHVLQQVKKTSNDSDVLLNKEKLCLEFERQLLEDEKKIITEEQEILGKEKEIIERERTILGGEKSVLDEERFILGKEKHGPFKTDQSDVLSEIEGVFEEACGLDLKPCHHHGPNFPHFNFNPVYVPVYSLPRPFFSCRKSKSVQTQTETTQTFPAQVDDAGLPFEQLLSGIFPRVVITSMGSFSHEDAVLKEIAEPSKTVKKPVPRKPQRKIPAKTLEIPRADLTLKAGTKKPKQQSLKICDKRTEDPETEESGIQTMTSEAQKDDNSGVSDGTVETFETLHFGLADDFYSNEAIFPGKGSSDVDVKQNNQLPLTTVGYDMFEKLSQLSLERDSHPVTAAQEGNEPKLSIASNLNLHVSNDGVAITLPGNISMYVKKPVCCGSDYDLEDHGAPDLTHENCEDDGKLLVKRCDLWHADTNLSRSKTRKKFQHLCQPAGLSISVPDGPEINLTLSAKEKLPRHECIQFLMPKSCDCDLKPRTCDKSRLLSNTGNQLSPRTADLLEALRKKLAFCESEKRVVSYGQSKKPENLNGLYFIKEFKKPEDIKDIKVKSTAQPREYLCEECLTTMRLYEDDFHTVHDLVDKFENLNRFGFK